MDGNGNSLLSTFFDDTWDEKRVKEEIAHAAAIGTQIRISDKVIKGKMKDSNLYMRLVYDNNSKLITAYIED